MTTLTIGLIFDLLPPPQNARGNTLPNAVQSTVSGAAEPLSAPNTAEVSDHDAEYEPEATIKTLEAALRHLGHCPVRVGSARDLLQKVRDGNLPALDAALNISEGCDTRNREAWAPVLLEMLGIPTLGSDALTLSMSLDKWWTKNVIAAAGVPTPAAISVSPGETLDPQALPADFPLFVKPRWEGTAKGIRPSSRVEKLDLLRAEVERVCSAYQQPALVEKFIEGAEYTVTVVGNNPPKILPVLQRATESITGIGLHALESHSVAPSGGWQHEVSGVLDAALEKQLGELARLVFTTLRCYDFARIDFRVDQTGQLWFLEINPLPTFAPDGSFGILAELAGQPVEEFLAEVFRSGLRRLGF